MRRTKQEIENDNRVKRQRFVSRTVNEIDKHGLAPFIKKLDDLYAVLLLGVSAGSIEHAKVRKEINDLIDLIHDAGIDSGASNPYC